MSNHIQDITIKDGKVKMRFVKRNSWGTIESRQQITIPKWEFERAMREAEVTVPWKDVAR